MNGLQSKPPSPPIQFQGQQYPRNQTPHTRGQTPPHYCLGTPEADPQGTQFPGISFQTPFQFSTLQSQFVPPFGYASAHDINKQAYSAPRMPVGGNPSQAAMFQNNTGVRQQPYYNQTSMRPSTFQISQPQPSQGLYTQQQIMFMPPPQYSAATQQVIMPMTAQSYPQRMASTAYQNSMPNSQQGLFQMQQQNTANYTPHAHTHTYNNPPAVFYNAAQQNRPPSASGMSGPGQLPAKKRERTVLQIIDPNSGKDIMQDLQQTRSTPPSSGTLGSHGSQEFQVPNTAQNEIAAQFAAQVAQVALSSCTGGNQPRILPDAEDNKKDVRGKKKAKDINRKGEMIQGSEMDAFIDLLPETEASTPVVEKEENDLSECTKEEKTETTPAPLVNEEVVDHMDINNENVESYDDVSIASENVKSEKMKYKEDQINHEGKKCDGDFQLQPQNATETVLDTADIPADIPDIIIEKPPETEASSPVVEEEEDPIEGTIDQDRAIAAETTSPTPFMNEEVDNTVDINNENDVSEVFENEKNEKLKLKYKYKEDQWSPINHEGKKQYDRDFLLQLQNAPESTLKPLDLPDIPDIIIEKPSFRPVNRDFAEGNNFVDFTPRYVWSGGPNRSGGVPRRSSGQRGRGGPGGSATQAKHINLSIQKDIELHHAKEAWKPGHRAEKIDQGDVDLKSEELYKKVRSILNKLTPQKFQTLVAKMQALEIDTEARLKNVIDLVFEKAISEPEFSVAYANMCRCLSMFKVPAESKQGDVNFRALLLTRCQREFEKANSSEKEFDTKRKEIEKATMEEQKLQMKEELEYEETKAKRRSLGNIRFIGELFKLKMLTENIMHDCVFKLLRTKDEENLECLCRLLKTIGKELDTEKAKPRMDQYFQQMIKIVNEKKLSSRVRFMLQDVIELRRGKWVPRRDDNNPKTIDQIHREVAQEAQDRAIFVQTLPQAKPQKGNRGRPGQPSGPMGGGADGWNTVSRAPLRTDRTIDPSKLKLSKLGDSENIQLGPGGGAARLGWFKGSTGGGARSQEGERPNAPGNRFSALSKAEDDGSRKGAGRGGFGRPAPTANHPSQESEREKALAAAKTIVAQRPSEERSGGRETERAKTMEKPSTPVQELTDDQMLSKTRAIMDEYLHIQDVKEAISCVQELSSSGSLHLFVSNALNQVLERSEVARRQTGLLLHDLVKNNVLMVDTYVKGLNEILMFAEDMEIDIPKIWEYLGQLIGPMVQDGSVPLGFLKQVCEPLRANDKSGILVAEILHDASHREGHKKVGKLWAESGLNWLDFVPKNQIDQFLYEKKLDFTTVGSSAPTSPTASMAISKIEERLNDLITDKGCSNEEVFDWIEGEVDELTIKQEYFIRALMTAVCKSAVTVSSNNLMKVDKSQVQRRNNLLQKYLDHQANFELQALFALQALVHKLEHPPGVLRELFDILYDEDIISEDAFIQWEKSEDPQEQEGKGVAMKQVVQFFTWLKEAEDDAES
ncbi:hypothetical protein CHS0354_010275 [Potamilus streckersoni]|nr:hypothetical protein CHS0354_010275 [Potamilus streckersoni]